MWLNKYLDEQIIFFILYKLDDERLGLSNIVMMPIIEQSNITLASNLIF